MKLCLLGIHKWTQWKTPRNHIQTRLCMYCGIYQRVQVLVNLPGMEVTTHVPVNTFDLEELDVND